MYKGKLLNDEPSNVAKTVCEEIWLCTVILKLYFVIIKLILNPFYHPAGGFVIDRLMSADEMRQFAELPSLPGLHGQLVGILSSATSRTYQLLQTNQNRLSSNLGQLAKQTNEEDTDNKNEEGS